MRTEKQKAQLKKAQSAAWKANIGKKMSKETRKKIGLANRGVWIKYNCDYCGNRQEERKSHYSRKNRHFCNIQCYALYRKEIMPKEEQPRFGTGESAEIKIMKIRCRSDFNHYLRDKKIKRKPCEVCGNLRVHAHHDDYYKPLEVRWLCVKHHNELHVKLREKELLNDAS